MASSHPVPDTLRVTTAYPASVAATGARPVLATFVWFPIVAFTLALATDVAYWRTANIMWQNFSAWLLFVGLLFGVCAALGSIIGLLFGARSRSSRPAWILVAGGVIVLLLAFFNSLIHAGDGWTAVVPTGLVLSVAIVLLMLVTTWIGRSVAFRDAAALRARG